MAAIELLLREGLGRPPRAEEPRASRVADSVEAIEKMPWQEMQELFAAIFVDEVAAIQDRGAREVVRQKIAGCSASQRDVLRLAIADVEQSP